MFVNAERQKRVSFSIPTAEDVTEVVVTGPSGPTLNDLDDLNRTLFVFAPYNAGPTRIVELRKKAAIVSNIYRYYVSYKLAVDQSWLQQNAEHVP